MIAIEIAMFQLKPDTDLPAFGTAIDATNNWLSTQNGFIRRQHGEAADGSRVDYIEWKTMQEAQAASQRFMTAEDTQAYLAAIDPPSITMHHYEG